MRSPLMIINNERSQAVYFVVTIIGNAVFILYFSRVLGHGRYSCTKAISFIIYCIRNKMSFTVLSYYRV